MSESTTLRSPDESAESPDTAADTRPPESLVQEITCTRSHTVEVIGDDSNTWAGNGLRFGTKHEAESYAKDLARRWTSVRKWRTVESNQAPSHSYVDGKVARL